MADDQHGEAGAQDLVRLPRRGRSRNLGGVAAVGLGISVVSAVAAFLAMGYLSPRQEPAKDPARIAQTQDQPSAEVPPAASPGRDVAPPDAHEVTPATETPSLAMTSPSPAPEEARPQLERQAEVASAPMPVAPSTVPTISGEAGSTGSVREALVVPGEDTPMECLPPRLRANLEEVARRFGRVDVVSTTHMHTENHGKGRVKIHADCMAVDFRTPAPPPEVTAFLRTREGVGGIQSFRNGVIHVDDAGAHPADSYGRRGGPEPQDGGPANQVDVPPSR